MLPIQWLGIVPTPNSAIVLTIYQQENVRIQSSVGATRLWAVPIRHAEKEPILMHARQRRAICAFPMNLFGRLHTNKVIGQLQDRAISISYLLNSQLSLPE